MPLRPHEHSRFAEAETKLDIFSSDFPKYYGNVKLVYNVHLSSHLPNCIHSWGTLSTFSNFPFEDCNVVRKSYLCQWNNIRREKNYFKVPSQIENAARRCIFLERDILITSNFFQPYSVSKIGNIMKNE